MSERGKYFDRSKKPLNKSRQLMVEGLDDLFFFNHILDIMNADPETVAIVEIGGVGKVDVNLQSLIKSREYQEGKITKVAAIRDADTNPSGAVMMMQNCFRKVGWPCPSHAGFAANDTIEAGLFILPSDLTPGDLERICFNTVSSTRKAADVEEFFERMVREHGHLDREFKRKCAIYLACTPTETRGPGNAFSRGVFDVDHQTLAPLKEFIAQFLS